MSDRSASSSLQGYDYQLIHTFIDILNTDENDSLFTIEGLEDLDIEEEGSLALIQYKYHELANYQDSKVAKPIGLMFNHYINNVDSNVTYNLYIHLNSDLPVLSKDKVDRILKLKSATDYYEVKNENIEKLDSLIEGFSKKLLWKRTEKYGELLKSLEQRVCEVLNLSTDEAEFVVIPNGLRILMAIAICKNVTHRKITKEKFISKLKNSRNIVSASYLVQYFDKEKYAKYLKSKLHNLSVTKNGSDFVICFNTVRRHEIEHLILNLSKQFFFKGNKIDFRPVTFILNCTKDELELLKLSVINLSLLDGSNVKFNDGYERYIFNKHIFNEKAITTTSPNRSKINEVNYNFKLIRYETFCRHKEKISFTNTTCFIIDNHIQGMSFDFSRIIHLDRIDNDEIIRIIGGC